MSSQGSPFSGDDSRYKFLFERMRQGFCIIEKIADSQQQPNDFRYLLVNPAFKRHTGMDDVVGKTIKEVLPDAELSTLELYNRVADTGETESFQKYIPALNLWMEGEAFSTDIPGQVAVLFANTNAQKTAEQQLIEYNEQLESEVSERTQALQTSQEQLQSVFDTTLLQISILQAVRNQDGTIDDFEIKLVNQELERETGRNDLVGKYYAQEYSGIRSTGLFDIMVKAIETGEPQQTEYYYPHEGFDKWYACMFVKMNDSIVATNLDITARKQAEEERFQNYILLQQSEEVAGLGSWYYEVPGGKFTWSKGMYKLFNLDENENVKPEIYLQYATDGGRAAAERIVGHIRQGDSSFEEILEIELQGSIKVLHLKATIMKNKQGQPVRALGVDMDVTEMRRAEEKIRKMEAEQQLEVFRASLETLEEERHRISESLHNGLGQILYGAKINFSGMSLALEPETFQKAKAYTQDLITEAIKETRRISHDLMPTILEEFGLKAAIEDVCQQFDNHVHFEFSVRGFNQRIEKYLELAIYRTVQELVNNVVKHARASEATVEVVASKKQIKIRVSDNGQGIEAANTGRPGIGLASIRSKIKLLDGKFDIQSGAEIGTTVEITLPQPDQSFNN